MYFNKELPLFFHKCSVKTSFFSKIERNTWEIATNIILHQNMHHYSIDKIEMC